MNINFVISSGSFRKALAFQTTGQMPTMGAFTGLVKASVYEKGEAVVNRFAIVMIMIILLCSGCGNGNAGEDTARELQITEETQQVKSAQQEAFAEPEPEEKSEPEQTADSESYDEMIKNDDYFEGFEELEKNHKILAYDICASPKYDYENTPLAEYIEADIAWNEEMAEKMGEQFPLEIDYHLFDFNDDGIEDYLLCRKGRLFDGREGNSVEIFIREEDGVRCVLSRVMWLHNDSGHGKLAVLDEKTGGYYAIVPPCGGMIPEDIILKYNVETEQYEGEEDGRNYCMMPEDSDFVNFKDLDKNHKILAYDVCSSPKYDYENTPLADYIEETFVADVEERSKIEGRELPCDIDYHLFDFNDDGIEDYLLCVCASGWGGSGGNHVEIYIQEEGGVRKVLNITARLHVSLSEHEMFTVLDEKTNGYRAIVFEESHYILRYDAEREWYSYEKAFNGETEIKERINVEVIGELYDSYLDNHSYYAIYDYLERFGGDKEIPWKIDENISYIGDGGIIISVSCIAGTEKVNLFIDTYNKTYAVFN